MAFNNNRDYIDPLWTDEFLRGNKEYALFIQQKAKAVCESQPVLDYQPITQVIKLKNRLDAKPTSYHVEKTELLSVHSLLTDMDINTESIEEAAHKQLGPRVSKIAKVISYDDRHNPDLARTYFVRWYKLANVWSKWWLTLRSALMYNRYALIMHLLNQSDRTLSGASAIDRRDLLCRAARTDCVEIFKQVLELTGWLETPNGHSDVLQAVANSNSLKVLEYLIEEHPDKVCRMANPTDPIYDPPVLTAALSGHEEMAIMILEHTEIEAATRLNPFESNQRRAQGKGIDDALTDDDMSLLVAAICQKQMRLIEKLIRGPFMPAFIEKTGEHALTLHIAAINLDYPLFKELYDAFAKMNKTSMRSKENGYTVFHTIVQNKPLMALLFMRDIVPDYPLLKSIDNHGRTPLHWAASEGHTDAVIVLYFIYIFTRSHLIRDKDGHTFFNVLVQNKRASIIKELIERPDFDPRLIITADNDGSTPLIWASMLNCLEICELLYDLSDQTNSIQTLNKRGCGALDYGIDRCSEPIVYLLTSDHRIANKCMIKTNRGYTLLHYAAIISSTAICARIYSRVGPNQVCMQTRVLGLTALHLAVLYRSVDTIKVMLGDYGKNRVLIGIRDTDGKTAMDYAHTRSPEIAAVIQAAMDA